MNSNVPDTHPPSNETDRTSVFISHATPDDNELVLWLGTRLTALGYDVWADILKLRGGQDWTEALEQALKQKASKVLLVATPLGLSKKGVQREIKIAQQVATKIGDNSFIIPLRKERYELTFDTALAQHIDFTENWGRGLAELVKTLEEYGVPRPAERTPGVPDSWRALVDSERATVEAAEERLLSNALAVTSLPRAVGIFRARYAGQQFVDAALNAIVLPHVRLDDIIIGFCGLADYNEQLTQSVTLELLHDVPFEEFARDGLPIAGIAAIDARRHLISLLRQHWDAHCRAFGLQPFEFSGRSMAWWPTLENIGEDYVSFRSPLGGTGRRQLIGRSLDLQWHYGVTAIPRLGLNPSFTLVNRVIFTTDGKTPVAEAVRMHRLRRSRCKMWHNDRWRDLLLAFTHWLAEKNDAITFSCGSNDPIEIAAQPRIYLSNVRLVVPDDILERGDDSEEEFDDDE